ncbi:hypothetical protein Bhyg_04319 [Pseudolycoriella hygida]|uniref:Jacalin-type lectin domain-containing protein n=1 Tax=Pseudolycoriella hygida TaxID=35572 RepID=A0A9Q0NG62_9DIPT|nr:hypothetical protein Bhyg_04319 [Pseudolycoriella hygida]
MTTWTILVCLLLRATATLADDPYFQAASHHGGTGGTENAIECPYGGAITGVNYRAAQMVDQLEFVCTSSVGKSTIGPYGGGGGSPGSLNCPEGHYVGSFVGRSAAKLDRFGIRCRPENDMNSDGVIVGQFGGGGGTAFDELAFSIGSRPISIKVRSGSVIDGFQVTYGNIPISGKLCTSCNNYREEWAPQHGGDGGNLYTFICPAEGVITGIKYRVGTALDQIQFICTSSLGETTAGPWGGSGGTPGEDRCPPGSYISSIHGRSGSRVDQLGIRCTQVGQAGGSPKRDGHGGTGGYLFDDESYSSNYRRPIQIRIRAASRVDAIQIKYGNLPVALNCKVTKVAVTDSNIMAKDDGYEVIGLSSGSTCSNQVQQLTVSKSSSVTETVGAEMSIEDPESKPYIMKRSRVYLASTPPFVNLPGGVRPGNLVVRRELEMAEREEGKSLPQAVEKGT